MTGAEIAAGVDAQALDEARVYARIRPEQKVQIVHGAAGAGRGRRDDG